MISYICFSSNLLKLFFPCVPLNSILYIPEAVSVLEVAHLTGSFSSLWSYETHYPREETSGCGDCKYTRNRFGHWYLLHLYLKNILYYN